MPRYCCNHIPNDPDLLLIAQKAIEDFLQYEFLEKADVDNSIRISPRTFLELRVRSYSYYVSPMLVFVCIIYCGHYYSLITVYDP